jgi:FkbH-like protein
MESIKEIKCIVWDLDNTIWDGVLLESDEVRLKPGIKNVLEALDGRGILHSIASKNNHEDAVAKLKEFGIDHYFLYPKINWNAKSSSIAEIQANLNFGIDTFAFVDDQEFEREEVKSQHPDVLFFDAMEYEKLLEHQRFNPRFITEDSRKRREMYHSDIIRNIAEKEYQGPQEQFLASLNMKFIISEAKEEDLKRAEELTVRTNQLNATGRTYDYDELNEFRLSPDYKLLVCELTDKYGSYGKIGLALVHILPDAHHIKLLLMSCRVMSRGVGTILLTHIMNGAKAAGKKLLADFKPTSRNRMMLVAFRFANFVEVEKYEEYVLLQNDLTQIQPFPDYINVTITN